MKNEDWQDNLGRVFVLYTIPNLAKDIGKVYTIGQKVRVMVARADEYSRQIDFALVGGNDEKRG